MNIQTERRTAKILMFPTAAVRSALILSNRDKFAAELARLDCAATEFGSGWYHDAAIADAHNRKN